MRAMIKWKTQEEGGRRTLPLGRGEPPYAAVVRFKGDNGPWPPEIAWNLIVRKHSNLEEHKWIADVAYKMPNAPHETLIKGREFELFEGSKCVAEGILE